MLALACPVLFLLFSRQNVLLESGALHKRGLGPTESATFQVTLRQGESALITVRQIGVDVVVDVFDPSQKLIDSVDSPTGRSGEETVELMPDASGPYRLVVRPFDDREPAGEFELRVRALRDAAVTRTLLAERKRIREAAGKWVRARSTPLVRWVPQSPGALIDAAKGARIIGLGEATHGSQEFNDARLALTKYLVRSCGYRLIAVELSASKMLELETHLAGGPPHAGARTFAGWIGHSSYPSLISWVRSWNIAHPRDRVRLAGVDAGGNTFARKVVDALVTPAYRPELVSAWRLAKRELEDADAQNAVFGDSDVDVRARATLQELHWRLSADSPILSSQFGSPMVRDAQRALDILLEFADYNSWGQSRDWYMAAGTLRALAELGPNSKGVYWAHNAHVAVPARATTTGRYLRDTLGKRYIAVASTAGTGSFVAQRPNDPADRLVVSPFLPAKFETVEGVLRAARPQPFLALWPRTTGSPAILREPLPMHWIGGLYLPGEPPATQFSHFRLLADFDGIVYIPSVKAIPLPPARPIVPARVRRYGK